MADDRPSSNPTQPPVESKKSDKGKAIRKRQPNQPPSSPQQDVAGCSGYRAPAATHPQEQTKKKGTTNPADRKVIAKLRRDDKWTVTEFPDKFYCSTSRQFERDPTTATTTTITTTTAALSQQQLQSPPPQQDVAGFLDCRTPAATNPQKQTKRRGSTTPEDRKEIAKLRRGQWTVTELSKKFKCSESRIRQICDVQSELDPTTATTTTTTSVTTTTTATPPQQQQQPPPSQ